MTIASNHPVLTNRPYADLAIGDTARLTRLVSQNDINLFAAMSGDVNPTHMDAAYAATDAYGHIVVQGMWTASLISTLLGTELPGPGTVYLDQDLQFRHPVVPGDAITASVTVEAKHENQAVTLATRCVNQDGLEVLVGTARVKAPTEKLTVPRMDLPDVSIHRHDRFEAYLAAARARPALTVAVVHPCNAEAISAAIEARDEGLMVPVLVGPEAKIRAAAEAAGLSIEGLTIVTSEHSHESAAKAVDLASTGAVQALMKGSLHTDELLGAVIGHDSRLKTARRISHVYVLDVPSYPKPLVVTDAAINIAPTLDHKRDICQNAVDFLHTLGVAEPLVAVLAAVETVSSDMPATLDAAALTAMARRGQITGALVDGPLALDNAVNFDAARIKAIVSPVAGQADILLVPNLEAGNILAKQLIYLAGADAAGLVLGARVPIILTSRADSLKTRLASVALAMLTAPIPEGTPPPVPGRASALVRQL